MRKLLFVVGLGVLIIAVTRVQIQRGERKREYDWDRAIADAWDRAERLSHAEGVSWQEQPMPKREYGWDSAIADARERLSHAEDASWQKQLETYIGVLKSAEAINNPNYYYVNGRPVLFYAVEMSHIDAVKWLLQEGANVNARSERYFTWNPEPTTALLCAVEKNNVEMVKVLIEAGANVNNSHEDETKALVKATRNTEIVRMLLANGADVNASGKPWSNTPTALMSAVFYGNIETIKLLLEAGADVNAKIYTSGLTNTRRDLSNAFTTALQVAKEGKLPNGIDRIEHRSLYLWIELDERHAQIVELLKTAGAQE